MKYFLLAFFLLTAFFGFGQHKKCSYPYDSIVVADSANSQSFLDTLESLQLKTYCTKSKIPRFIKKAMACWHDGAVRLADPGKFYYCCCSRGFWFPSRQLSFLAKNEHYLLLVYVRGGYATNCPVLLVRFDKKKIRSVWNALVFDTHMTSKEDLVRYIKNGSYMPAVKANF